MPTQKPIAIVYEHPDWFRPLFRALDARSVPWVALDAGALRWDPQARELPWSLVFNRASPSAPLRGRPQAVQPVLHFLRHVERLGVPTFNGSAAFGLELSKANQLDVLADLGLPFPRTRVINHPSQASAAAEGLQFPVLVKANVGGSGAGIFRFDTPAELASIAAEGSLDLGIDHTALVQELLPIDGGRITRVEVLDGEVLYGIHVYPEQGSFNLCPADACQTPDGRELTRGACAVTAAKNGMKVERAEVQPWLRDAVLRIARRLQLDVGGIELLFSDGKPYFYDLNALSNFVADPVRVVGFDPFARLADALAARAFSRQAA